MATVVPINSSCVARRASEASWDDYVLRQGLSPEELVREFKHLTLAQVYDALSYYYDHRDEIDRELAENEEDIQRRPAIS